MAGYDYAVDKIWLWNKIVYEPIPDSYIELMRQAKNLVVVRSTSPPEGILGVLKENLYVCSNISLSEYYHDQISNKLIPIDGEGRHLRQWEWGLPDDLIHTLRRVWLRLGKSQRTFILIEDETRQLYVKIMKLWEEYLKQNGIKIRGLVSNAYWIAHPYFEKVKGLIPVNFYSLKAIRSMILPLVQNYAKQFRDEGEIYGFVNSVGHKDDVETIKEFWARFGWGQDGYFSIGFDCRGADCRDVFGEKLLLPYQEIAERLGDAEFRDNNFIPLNVTQVRSAFS